MSPPLDSRAVMTLHDAALDGGSGTPSPHSAAWEAVAANHRCNARLWVEEDHARRRDVPDADIAARKRAIDALNQQRNDAVERLDEALLAALGDRPSADARLHSETPGMMVDRLSILALKCRAMAIEAARADAPAAQREACAARLERLREQRADLAGCLDALIAECLAGRARFKVYRQFKMYNDPALNPALYRRP